MAIFRRPEDIQLTKKLLRFAWLILGWFALGFGAVGVVLPLLPTTPFVLLAAFAFAKGSPRMRHWLVNHRIFGSMIRDWEAHGAIARRYKILACCMMVAALIGGYLANIPLPVFIIQLLALSGAATYVLTRPSETRGD